MPARDTLRSRLTRHQNKNIGAVRKGEHCDDWPESITRTNDGRSFLYYDSASNMYLGPPLQPGFISPAPPPRFLVFATNSLLRLLELNRHWSMDGTFFASPNGFKQMYVVGSYAMNVDGTSTFYHCIYFLLQSKKEETYHKSVLQSFPSFAADDHPISIMMGMLLLFSPLQW